MEKLFTKINDAEVLDCIRENKVQYAATEADCFEIIHDFCGIIEADEECTMLEEQMVRALGRVME